MELSEFSEAPDLKGWAHALVSCPPAHTQQQRDAVSLS